MIKGMWNELFFAKEAGYRLISVHTGQLASPIPALSIASIAAIQLNGLERNQQKLSLRWTRKLYRRIQKSGCMEGVNEQFLIFRDPCDLHSARSHDSRIPE